METNGKNRFASQGVSIAQMMYVSKYKSHKIALFNSMKKSNIAPISLDLHSDEEARVRFATFKQKRSMLKKAGRRALKRRC